MLCPNCKEERKPEVMDPTTTRLGIEGGALVVRVRLRDLCPTCGYELRVGLAAFSLDLTARGNAQGHLGVDGHTLWANQDGSSRRGMIARYRYSVGCSCGRMKQIEGTFEGEAEPATEEHLNQPD